MRPIGRAGQLVAAAALATSLVAPPARGQEARLSAAEEGRRLWLKLNCYGCHGMDGRGGMGPKVRGEGISFGIIATRIFFGGPEGMPSYRTQVSDTDVENLAAYIAAMGGKGEPTFNLWWKPNPRR